MSDLDRMARIARDLLTGIRSCAPLFVGLPSPPAKGAALAKATEILEATSAGRPAPPADYRQLAVGMAEVGSWRLDNGGDPAAVRRVGFVESFELLATMADQHEAMLKAPHNSDLPVSNQELVALLAFVEQMAARPLAMPGASAIGRHTMSVLRRTLGDRSQVRPAEIDVLITAIHDASAYYRHTGASDVSGEENRTAAIELLVRLRRDVAELEAAAPINEAAELAYEKTRREIIDRAYAGATPEGKRRINRFLSADRLSAVATNE